MIVNILHVFVIKHNYTGVLQMKLKAPSCKSYGSCKCSMELTVMFSLTKSKSMYDRAADYMSDCSCKSSTEL